MASFKTVIFTLNALLKTGNTPKLSDRRHLACPASQDFMNIALMSNIKKDLVSRSIKTVMQSDRQFDNTQITGKMPTGLRYCFNKKSSNIGCKVI